MSRCLWRRVLLPMVMVWLAGGTAGAGDNWKRAWSLSAQGDWAPVAVGTKIVVRGSDYVEAIDLLNGKRMWKTKVPGLLEGSRVLGAAKGRVYAITSKALVVLDAADGTVKRETRLKRPSGLLAASGSVFVAHGKGVTRFDPSGRRSLAVISQLGHLEAADASHVVLHQPAKGRKRPNRLIAVSFESGDIAYKFKLLPRGAHRIVGFSGHRLAFIDYTRRHGTGNKKKLYFTEADVQRNKKLRDVSLSGNYTHGDADTFEVVRSTATGRTFMANFGAPGVPAMLLAYDAQAKRVAWTRSGPVASGRLTLAGGLLWATTHADGDKSADLVAYQIADGNIVARLALDGKPLGAPVAVGDYVLVRTQKSVQCFTSSQPPEPTPEATTLALPPVPQGFRKHHDERLGYAIYVPQAWRLARKRVKRFGKGRLSIPFIRYEWARGRWQYQASVHVLIRPAMDQTARQVWEAVLEQRQRRAKDVRARRVTTRKIDGVEFVQGTYRFIDGNGLEQRATSLCAVQGDRAYEVRARVNPFAPRGVWKEVAQVLRTVRVGRYPQQ